MTTVPKKPRSPNYPALSLPQAVQVLQKLWKAEKRTPVSHETAATAMGFKSLSGPARVAVGTLRQYGLIDKSGKGHIRISELGVRVVIGDDADKRGALQQAASAPELFQELAKAHGEASDNAIQSFLITRKGFAADGARKAAKAFRDTLALAKPSGQGYTPDETQEQPEIMTGTETGQIQNTGKPSDGVFSLTVPFAKGTIAVQVRVTGDKLTAAHMARVREYLKLAESDLDGAE